MNLYYLHLYFLIWFGSQNFISYHCKAIDQSLIYDIPNNIMHFLDKLHLIKSKNKLKITF